MKKRTRAEVDDWGKRIAARSVGEPVVCPADIAILLLKGWLGAPPPPELVEQLETHGERLVRILPGRVEALE